MKALFGRSTLSGAFNRPRVTLGTFDGVHVGHQRVLRELVAWARDSRTDAVAVTFDRKPGRVISGRPFERITSLPHRLKLMEALGMDGVVVLEFDRALERMEPEDFAREVLVKELHAGGVLFGHDTRFGHKGRGDAALMSKLGAELGFEVRSVSVELLDGLPVSSTRVRAAIKAGDLPLVERLLGRRFSLLGRVVRGTARGATLGFPTANLELQHEIRPPLGVYATRVLLDGRRLDAVTNIGRPPTLRRDAPRFQSSEVIVETHIPGFSGDLYGREMEVEFVARLRAEKAFASPDALARQIARDIETARRLLKDKMLGRDNKMKQD